MIITQIEPTTYIMLLVGGFITIAIMLYFGWIE